MHSLRPPLFTSVASPPRIYQALDGGGAAAAVAAAARSLLADHAQQLALEDELALLVLLRGLVRLVVLPADRLAAAPAGDVANDVTARRHVALRRFQGVDVDHHLEEVSLAVLAAEVLCSAARVSAACPDN